MSSYADFRHRNIVVTGGANGIGGAIVRAFHAQEATVHFCDTDDDAGKSLARELGERAFFTQVDLTREAQIVRWVKSITKGGGLIQALVNNAARDPRMALESMSVRDWDDLFATNLRAYFLMAREVAPKLPDATGAIVNLASLTFHTAPSPMTAYVATKGGVLGFTRALARELGPRGIRVNTVSPGWIMTERQLKQFVTPAVKRLIRKSQCVPELLQSEDIAEVVLFLASGASRAITGQEILADRGWAHS
ncbi:short-chain dehydrogenase/reductase SDR [Chthoniobacter flavus Ellin428]|uniref:Short-chain dehydrogenase/reductase SDR n=1 Tax=Chthoniobacter flavus Ellin428 TaxID=497964 RepID=B4CX29_9BACT|nr:SDR family oxidoreductase [Chthoniobacter flavus]EDY21349.1 short-chain dehydrogenase/reductase SDR [Chthoniobacter flavus Ellin428]TCO84882.1 NAD(P)-dependent dehydrogenase (short-subunit alcohol dehydrogenase family) [Chthoniobacter flavus]